MFASVSDLLGGQLFPLLSYIGPGVDLALFSSVVGLLLTLGSSTLFLVIYPFRSLWRRLRGTSKMANQNLPSNP